MEIYKSIGADLGIEFEDDDEERYDEEEEEYYDESIQPYELVEPIETPGENRSSKLCMWPAIQQEYLLKIWYGESEFKYNACEYIWNWVSFDLQKKFIMGPLW